MAVVHGKLTVWGDWNRSHITGHGGSPEQDEALITDPETRWVVQDERTTKGFGLLIGQRWTLVVLHDDRSVYPVTMYPTQRGGMRHQRTP